MNLDYIYEKRFLKNESYDDFVVKNKIVEISEELLGFKTKINDMEKDIDLLSIDDPELRVEVERGGWFGDFWSDEHYCNKTNLGFYTLNMPDRKIRYWREHYYRNKSATELTHNPGWKKTLFVRTNYDFTQINIVRPETVLNEEKAIKNRFKADNSYEEENWISFRKEDVETYNLIDGKYVRDTEENGKYIPLSQERIEELTYIKTKAKLLIIEESNKRRLINLEKVREKLREKHSKKLYNI